MATMAESTANSFMWENMPTMVFKKIFSYLDRKSKKSVRRVCSIWKEEMDTESGLRVDIDSRIRGNIAFARSVKILQARIVYLKDLERNILLDPSSLRTVICTGIISPHWFTRQMVRCRHLTRLVLCGRFLHSQNLQMEGTTQLSFSSLKILEIIANEMSYPEPMPLSIRRRDPSRTIAYEEYCIEIGLTVVKNMTYLLENIHAHKLHTLHIYVRQQRWWTVPIEINWRFTALETFLELHRNSLQELLLPDFEGKYCLLHDSNRLYPQNLITLELMVSNSSGTSETSHFQNSEYWKNLLANQTRLNNLKLHVANFPNENAFFNPVLEAIGLNSCGFLANISLVMDTILDFQIDGALFQFCDRLKILTIYSKRSEATFINFSMLPSSLTKISIENCLILNPDPRSIQEFYQLEMLQLHTLCLDPGMHDLSLEVVKAFLNLRSLCYIGVNFSENAGNNENFQKILDNFRSYWDPLFLSMGLRVNFDYEVEQGWNEDIFDDLSNGRQDIYYVVPEINGFSYEPWYGTSNYWRRHVDHSDSSSVSDEPSFNSVETNPDDDMPSASVDLYGASSSSTSTGTIRLYSRNSSEDFDLD